MFNAQEVATQASERGENALEAVIFQLAGYASTCWERVNDAGVFESTKAKQAAESTVEWLRLNLHYEDDLQKNIARAINRASRENQSDTPDFILASYLLGCLENYERTVTSRDIWTGNSMAGSNG